MRDLRIGYLIDHPEYVPQLAQWLFEQWDGILGERTPDVRIRKLKAHMNRDQPAEAWALMERHAHLYTDTSWQPADHIQQAIASVGVQRILLGSDWPLLHDDLQGDALDALRRAASSVDVDRITRDNALAFVGD